MSQRVMAIDFGDKRTGLAVADTDTRLASPFAVLENLNEAQLVAAIIRIIKEERVDILICGLPLNMDGTPGPRVERTRKIMALLEAATGKKIIPMDERLSTFAAESRIAGQYTRRQKRRRLDAIAAAQILQDYLAGIFPADGNQ
ncbi:MAG: Holliday junction resolvase RuvX [Planctomycetia bacterium]|nr:Holliday junction resolvase RuvX [Planctomycetia bacterium]